MAIIQINLISIWVSFVFDGGGGGGDRGLGVVSESNAASLSPRRRVFIDKLSPRRDERRRPKPPIACMRKTN